MRSNLARSCSECWRRLLGRPRFAFRSQRARWLTSRRTWRSELTWPVSLQLQAVKEQEKKAQVEYERSTKDAQRAREEATRSLAEKSGVGGPNLSM